MKKSDVPQLKNISVYLYLAPYPTRKCDVNIMYSSVRVFSVKPIVVIRTVYHPMPGVRVGEFEELARCIEHIQGE